MNTALLLVAIALAMGMIAAATWLVGLWNCVLTWVNLMFSALVASSFFEPVADRLNSNSPESSYLVDLVAVWGLFIGTFTVLRIATEFLSTYRVQFDQWTETIGRSILAILIAVTFFAFASFTMHMAPLPITGYWGEHFQSEPESAAFGVGADRAWMKFVHYESIGALAEFRDSRMLNPYNLPTSTRVREFDPEHELMARYRQRRRILSEQNSLQAPIPK